MERSAPIRRFIYALTGENKTDVKLYRREKKALKTQIMYDIKIKVNNINQVKEATKHQIKVALDTVGAHAQEDVAQLAPVDTGRLKGSFQHKVGDNYVDIYTDVEYAPYQEFGTSRGIKPKHFMKNGITNNLSKYKGIIESELKKG